MNLFVYIPIIIFSILLCFLTNKYGTQSSISQLAKYNWYVLMIALCSQCLLIVPILELSSSAIQFIPFIGCFGIILTGITNVLNKEDSLIHSIAAIVSFICFLVWVSIINFKCLLPLLICGMVGRENLKFRLELGLIISVYITLLLLI